MVFGFIGYGSMAKLLIRGLIRYSHIEPGNICVTRNDKNKLNEITDTFAGVRVLGSCVEIAKTSNLLFICVKPSDVRGVLLEIAPFLTSDMHIISLAGTVAMDNLQKIAHCKISKMIPTITSEINSGVTLMCHNPMVTEQDLHFINTLLSPFGIIKLVDDRDIGFAAELTSCAPGFFASFLSHFSYAALKHTQSFSCDEVNQMVVQTLFATSKLLIETDMTFEQIVKRVATKGGITEAGILVFDENLPAVFDAMFQQTLDKRKTIEAKINEDFQVIE